jgi:tetratricopeptide (TPR) repeat protein
MFARLAFALIDQGKNAEALKTLDRCMEEIPSSSIELNFSALAIMEAYYRLGENEKANKIAEKMADIYTREMDYYTSLPLEFAQRTGKQPRIAFSVLQRLVQVTGTYKQTELNERLKKIFDEKKDAFVNSPAAKSIK